MAKEITAYQSSDGSIWVNKRDAERHESKLEFVHEYDFRENDLLWGNSNGKVDGDDLAQWIIANEAHVMKLLGHEVHKI